MSAFKQANKDQIAWPERVKLIQSQFPSVVLLDWKRYFDADPSIMGRIIGDIIKIDKAAPGKPGKRAAIDLDVAEQAFRQMVGEDYTMLPFNEAFKILIGNRSIRAVANRIQVSHTHVNNLLHGTASPDAAIMERIAKVFKREPSYFHEYRTAYIVGLLALKLGSMPEATVSIFRKMQAK